MRLLFGLFIISSFFVSCSNSEKVPDVSTIKIQLSTNRFEKELFTIDTVNFSANLEKLIAKYPSFGENFLSTILGTDPKWNSDSVANYVKGFITAYKNIYDSSSAIFKDFSNYENDIKKGLELVKYYLQLKSIN